MKKFISCFLVFAILLSLTPVYAIETVDDNYSESFCKHHPEHTEECGFSPGIEGLPCMHEHNSECYKEEIKCLFENVLDETENSQVEDSFSDNITNSEESNNLDNENILDDLGDTEDKEISNDIYNEATDEIINEDINTDKENLEEINIEEDLKIDDESIDDFSEDNNNFQDNNEIMSDDADEHICSIESGCITLVLDCPHERGEHDDTCGYIEAQPSQECQFVCKICKLQEIIDRIPDINDFFNLDNNEMEQVRKDVYSAMSLYEELTSEEASEIIGMDRVEELYMFLNASNSINGNEIELISATATESVAGGAESDFTNNGEISINYTSDINISLTFTSKVGISNKHVEIEIPEGIYLKSYSKEDGIALNNVDFIESDTFYGSYKSKYGTIIYDISSESSAFSIDLTVSIDENLWDKMENTLVGQILIKYGTNNNEYLLNYLDIKSSTSINEVIFLEKVTEGIGGKSESPFQFGTLVVGYYNTIPKHALKSLTIKIPIPYNSNTGEYAKLYSAEITTLYPAVTYSDKSINVDEENHIIIITYSNIVFNYFRLEPKFYWENNQGEGQICKWGTIYYNATYYNDNICNTTVSNINDNSQWIIYSSDKINLFSKSFNAFYIEKNTNLNKYPLYNIGKFYLQNLGNTTNKLTLVFNYKESDSIYLYEQSIPNSDENNIEVWYTTNLNNTERKIDDILEVYTGNSGNKYSIISKDIAKLSDEEYFKSIKVVIDKLDAGYKSWYDSGSNYMTEPFSVIVKSNSDNCNIENFATLSIYDNMGTILGESSINAHISNMSEATHGLIALRTSSTTFTAGIPRDITIRIESNGHYYGDNYSNVCLNPEIYIRIPSGTTVKVKNILHSVFNYQYSDDYILNESEYELAFSYTKDDYDYYKLKFLSDNGVIGGPYKTLRGLYGLNITLNITFNADVKTTSFNTSDIFAVKDKNLICLGGGALLRNDLLDFDNDGDINEYMSVDVSNSKITVNAVRRGLIGSNDGGNITATSNSNSINYTLNLENYSSKAVSATDAENFYYYIPVPKTGDNWGSHFQTKAFEFSTNLNGPANITGTDADLFEVKYSTTVQSSAAENSQYYYNNENNYVESSAITNWNDVKMIRVSVKNGLSVPSEAKAAVNINLLADTINGHAGAVNTFNSCGFTQYTVGDAINSGHVPTNSTTITLNNGLLLGKLYIDNNKNGQYDDGIDSLYTDTSVSVDAVSANGIQTFSAHVFDNGTYEFGNLPAGTYTLTVSNPGSTDANSSNPLKFLMNDGNISDNEMIYTKQMIVGNGNTTIATDIGFQRPFTVTFEDVEGCTVEYNEINVWMNDKISELPEIETNIDKRFENSWEYEDDKITSQELLDIIVTNNITIRPSLTQLYKVVFNGNGNTEGNVPPIQYLATGESILAPSGTGLKKDDDIFVGWTLSQENESFSNTNKEEAEEKIISQITINGYDIVVFAGYATDNNGNGTPDYNEETIKLYYNSNTEDIEILEEPTTITINSPFTLPTTTTFINGDYAFAGWSENPVDVVIDEEDANRANIVKSIVSDINKTVYAVWSKDDNKDGTPDYLEPQYHVNYVLEASFGTLDNSFECGHNHVTNTKEILMEKPEFSVNNAVFIGWSNYIFQGLVETETDLEDARIIKEVTFIDHDIEVYAVWGVDTNNDGNADVYEEHYNLIYNYNDGTNNHSKCNHIHVKNNSCDLTLSEPKITRENAVLIGWSLERIDSIVTNENEANQITLESILTFIDSDINIYAVWALDENNNKIPDYNEKALHVKYNSNSSKNEVITCTHHHVNNTSTSLEDNKFVYDGYVFVGWTSAPQDIIRDAETFASISFIGSVSFIEDDIDVYAAWAVDRNGNKIPDYNENEFFIIYHTNTENEDIIKSCGHPHLTLEKINISEDIPIPTQDGAKFLGWSLTQINHNIISAEEARTVKFEYFANFTDKNIEIYAVWAKDEDNNGIADYEDYCSITYDLRNGEYEDNRPTDTQVLYGTTITLPDGPYLTGYKFGGWRILGYEIVLSPGDKFTIKEDTVIQATWIKRQYSPDTDNNDKNENNDKIPEFIKPETPVSSVLDTNFEGPFMVGVSENSFEPDRFITRAEVAQIFYRLLKDKGNYENLNIFSDVPNNAWYKTAVNTLAAKGIIVGIGNSMFAPERYITRAEFCTIASRFAQTTSDRTNTYIDVNITDWFYPYVMNATGFGWVVGYNDYSFGPLNNLTRAEAATIVNRMLGRDDEFTNIIQKKEFYDVKPQYWWYQEILKATSFVSFG